MMGHEYVDIGLLLNAFSVSKLDFLKAYDVIVQVPTADVAPVVHGEWRNGNPICPVCGEDKFKDLDADVWSDWKPKYCPNCGAKMDGTGFEEQIRAIEFLIFQKRIIINSEWTSDKFDPFKEVGIKTSDGKMIVYSKEVQNG